MESSCLDEVDDTSILKTGRPCCYRPLSRSPCPQIGARLSQLSRSDLVPWAPSAVPGNERNFALFGHAAHLQSLMPPPDGAPDSVREAYHDWVNRRLLQEVRDSEPEVFAWIADRTRELIVNAAETTMRQLGD